MEKKNQVLDKLSYLSKRWTSLKSWEELNKMSEFVEPDRYVLIGFHEILMWRTIKNSCEHLFNQLMLQRVMISSGAGDSKVTKISTKASVFKSTTRVHAHSWPFGSIECSWLKSMFLNSSVHSNVRLIFAWPVHARVIQQFTTVFNCSSRYQLLVRWEILIDIHPSINEWMDEYRSINQ